MKFSESGIELVIEEIDEGAEKIFEAIEFIELEPYVKVGILEKAGKHKGSKFSVAQIASVHEYGSESVPQRSFIASTMFETEEDLENKTEKIFDKVIDGELAPRQGLAILGLEIQKNIKGKIDSNIPPPLKAGTIKAKTRDGKAGNVALIDTAQMRNSVQFEVVEDGRGESEEG